MLFWKKEKQAVQAIEEYLGQTEQTIGSFDQAMQVYFREGLSAGFEELVERTHHHESTADDKRRDIEQTMYRKELIPESRGDILGMLEAVDLVPNKCESVLYQIWTQKLAVPAEHIEQLTRMVRVNVESCALLFETVRSLFQDVRNVGELAHKVDEKEGESDQIEREIITVLFASDCDKADKILLKELILEIGALSDRAENAADRLNNIAVKRQS